MTQGGGGKKSPRPQEERLTAVARRDRHPHRIVGFRIFARRRAGTYVSLNDEQRGFGEEVVAYRRATEFACTQFLTLVCRLATARKFATSTRTLQRRGGQSAFLGSRLHGLETRLCSAFAAVAHNGYRMPLGAARTLRGEAPETAMPHRVRFHAACEALAAWRGWDETELARRYRGVTPDCSAAGGRSTIALHHRDRLP